MKLHIQYFALLRDQRGTEAETLESSAQTPEELYGQLKEKHNFSLGTNSLKVAVNDDFVSWDQPLAEGDSIVFIPPVAGG